MEKRLILTIVLSLLVVLGFQYFGPEKRPAVSTKRTREAAQADMLTNKKPEMPAPPAPSLSQAPVRKELTSVNTNKYYLSFSNIGGSLRQIVLKEYLDKRKEEELVSIEDPARAPFTLTMDILPGLEKRDFARKRIRNGLEYRFTEKGLIDITKRYVVEEGSHYIRADIIIRNLSGDRLPFSYSLVGPSMITKGSEVRGRSFVEADTRLGDDIWKTKSVKGSEQKHGTVYWTGLKNRYFALILQPEPPAAGVTVREPSKGDLVVSVQSGTHSLAPGETLQRTSTLYAGPLDEQLVVGLDGDMAEMIDYGFFGVVSKLLLKILRFFQSWVHNWGLAIICLTLLINAILFPLTRKSFASMQQMKKLQPHMQKLKEIHKDNPQKLNQEMMELYKKYNVNPLGGCLPLLLQMPIFIALYQGLVRSIELKGASFLWIQDLSKPDAVPLPFTLPVLGNSVNILPLLMVGMMVLQQKISQTAAGAGATGDQAGQQKMMMIMFPLLFGFLFYGMPSGLVLYWLTNTILMTGEQAFIGKQLNSE